jgi:hypothetical protein
VQELHGLRLLFVRAHRGEGQPMATNKVSQPAPLAASRRLPVTPWLGLMMHPSFLVSMCSTSPGASFS